MKYFQRLGGLLVLFTLALSPTPLLAQENTTITVVGSSVVNPIFQALADASEVTVDLNVTDTGTNSGLAQLCAGTADVTTATRPISVDEDANCTTNGISYIELLIGHNIIAFITNPNLTITQCLTTDNINLIFEPSAQGQVTNWNQVPSDSPETPNPDTPLTVLVPGESTPSYTVLDQLVNGDGLRADATVGAGEAEIVDEVSQHVGTVGVVSLNSATAAGDTLRIMSLSSGEATGCAAPSAAAVEDRLYSAANRLFVYVNRASLTKLGVSDLLNFVVSSEASPLIEAAGFTAPTPAAYETNRAVLAGTQAGRQFSREVVAYEIPPDVTGEVTIGGSAIAYSYLQSVTSALTAQYPSVTPTYNVEGQPAGIRRLCNGELAIVMTYSELSSDQAANCTANDISTMTVDLGAQATVLLASTKSDYLTCLTPSQLTSIWGPTSATTITNWNQIDENFPDAKMTLFAPNLGNSAADLMLIQSSGIDLPARLDTETDDDPLYRAAATANVEGALTFMSWPDYQQVLDNQQANIHLIDIDGGNGCIQPSTETVADGSYPLARPAKLIVSQRALVRPEVQSILWFLASDDNYTLIENAGLVGLNFGDLPELRNALQGAFTEATTAVAQTPVEVTPEATAEATAEVTPDSTSSGEG
jgi:phosphate transport system substrate-binding protein